MAAIKENRVLLTNCVTGVVTGLERLGSNPTLVLDPTFLSQCAFSAQARETYPFPPGNVHVVDDMPPGGKRAGRLDAFAGTSHLASRGMQVGLGSVAQIWSGRNTRPRTAAADTLLAFCRSELNSSTADDQARSICVGLKTTTPKA